MKPIFYYTELALNQVGPGSEVIIEHKELSRFGKLNTSEFNHALSKLKEKGAQVSLEWDILMSETDFASKASLLNELELDLIDSIRVQDPGAIEYVKHNLDHKITLILETGNHNLRGIQSWIDHVGERVNRVVLSVELDKKTVKNYCENLEVDVEFLVLGRILIFYTPRNLLSSLLPEDDEKKKRRLVSNEFLEASGESEESPHKGFPLIENKHGTFMFHIKRLFLLDCLSDLKECGVRQLRVDNRFDSEDLLNKSLLTMNGSCDVASFKKEYPYDVIKGYFNTNKTDVLFKKLKNYRLQRKDESYVGEVLETNKAHYMAILIKKSSIKLGDELKFITPEGKELVCKVHQLQNSVGVDIEKASVDELCLINYFGSVWPKSQVYLNI